MHIILLKFSGNKTQAPHFMAAHKDWLKKGFDDRVFLLAGSLEPGLGGAILAHNSSLPDIERRIAADPFVREKIVAAEILTIGPARADERLNFLLN